MHRKSLRCWLHPSRCCARPPGGWPAIILNGAAHWPVFSEPRLAIARNESYTADLRIDALAALPNGLRTVEPSMFNFLQANVDSSKPVLLRGAAASVLASAKLQQEQLLALAETAKTA